MQFKNISQHEILFLIIRQEFSEPELVSDKPETVEIMCPGESRFSMKHIN